MLIVQNCIITDDIVDRCFGCDLAKCKGRCCVEGDSGAPLLKSEIAELERALPTVRPYMTEEGILAVDEQGVYAVDKDGDLGTPLIDGGACAYIAYAPDGTALCAIEMACREGKCSFLKPVSCHLYPLRLDDFGEFISINYHRWDVCRCAAGHGEPLYVYLREPLIRRFGKEWYDELLHEVEEYKKNKPSRTQ